ARRRQLESEVAEHRRAEDRLRESVAEFREIVGQSAAGIAEVDLDGRFVLANRRYCEMVGRPAEELYKLRMQEITHPDDLPGNLPLFEQAVQGGPPYVLEKRYIRPDGAPVWVNLSCSPVRHDEDGPRRILAIAIDVTDRRRAEERLRAQNER